MHRKWLGVLHRQEPGERQIQKVQKQRKKIISLAVAESLVGSDGLSLGFDSVTEAFAGLDFGWLASATVAGEPPQCTGLLFN